VKTHGVGLPLLLAERLLLRWLPRLAPGAEAHLVVGKNLGADSLQRWIAEQLGDAAQVERLAAPLMKTQYGRYLMAMLHEAPRG
jgi:hypothetical protein